MKWTIIRTQTLVDLESQVASMNTQKELDAEKISRLSEGNKHLIMERNAAYNNNDILREKCERLQAMCDKHNEHLQLLKATYNEHLKKSHKKAIQ